MTRIPARFPRTPVARACAALAAGAALGAAAPHALAATPAGAQIKNLATVTYQDAAGNTYSAQSNEAVVTVAQVYSATIGQDVDRTAAPGQTVLLPFVLTNTGNGEDEYVVSVADTGALGAQSIAIYRDVGGDGALDDGEQPLASGSAIALGAGDIENLVVAVEVPGGASANDALGVTLTAQAREGTPGSVVAGGVEDVGANADGADDTVQSTITVTGDAVLVVNKASVHDVAAETITYTVSVRNDGGRAAKDVVLFDALPVGTTYVDSSVSGIQTNLQDQVDTSVANLADEGALAYGAAPGLDLNADGDASDSGEGGLGIDLNQDGATSDAVVPGVYAVDRDLAVGATVSMSVTVSYAGGAFAGGHTFRNVGYVSGDTDDVPGNDRLVASGLVQDTLASAFGVRVDDTGEDNGPGDAVNDGEDDDGSNDDQFVTSAAAGGIVEFTADVTNTGNSDDVFALALDAGNFPANTVFTFHDAATGLDLSTGSGAETGQLAPGETRRILVKAALPADARDPADEYQGTITATSRLAPQGTLTRDDVAFSLGAVVVARADIHDFPDGTLAADENPLDVDVAVRTFGATIGASVEIPLYVDNESDAPDSYALLAGSSWNGTALGDLPPGWSVEFRAADANGDITGTVLTSTPQLPVGTVNYKLFAVVTVPNDPGLAVGNASLDRNADGTPSALDGNGDADGDYPIFFRIESSNTGAGDVTLDAIDVEAARAVTLVDGAEGEVEAGGNIVYNHVLTNAGSTTETLAIESANSVGDFNHTLTIDTDGDGTPDRAIEDLAAGDITVRQIDGTNVTVAVTIDGAGVRSLTLPAGASLPLVATVFAPSTATAGVVDTLTITATNADAAADAPSVSVSDRTTVIDSKVRLTKSVAIDANCDDVPEGSFAAVLATPVAPDECAIWEIVAENVGTEDALSVEIVDAAPLYSAYEPDSLAYCQGAGCAPDLAAGAAAGTVAGSTVTFRVGDGADPANGAGGTLAPNGFVTVRFGVRVQ